MTDEMLKTKLAVLEHDILQAAEPQPLKQMGTIGVSLEEKVRLAASLKRQLVARAATRPDEAAVTP